MTLTQVSRLINSSNDKSPYLSHGSGLAHYQINAENSATFDNLLGAHAQGW
jgi:hypothetical protein